MLWVIVWVVLGVGAVVFLGWLALRVWRRMTALTAELATVADRAAQALELLDEVQLPEAADRIDDAEFDEMADSGFTAARRVNGDQAT